MVEIKKELLQGILNYLVKQPFVEVQGFITGIQSCKIKADKPNICTGNGSKRDSPNKPEMVKPNK